MPADLGTICSRLSALNLPFFPWLSWPSSHGEFHVWQTFPCPPALLGQGSTGLCSGLPAGITECKNPAFLGQGGTRKEQSAYSVPRCFSGDGSPTPISCQIWKCFSCSCLTPKWSNSISACSSLWVIERKENSEVHCLCANPSPVAWDCGTWDIALSSCLLWRITTSIYSLSLGDFKIRTQ